MRQYVLCASILLAPLGAVAAEEETIQCRLVTRMVDASFVETPIEGRTLAAGKWAGTAICQDGRLANKEHVLQMESRGETGSYSGYSTYTFVNGDSLTLGFTGGWGPDGNGGTYTLLSGTGAYEDTTGTGTFTAVEEPWDNASLYDVTIEISSAD